ncbi:MAG: hypothetical protein ACRC20_12295 [Segniliparus sp.]|uniref:hypothetical protein n=1 Tax=Segniliparus sp. TaxID=2804064 RepID=UPI003F3AAA78
MADDEMTKLTVKLPTVLARQMKVHAIQSDQSIQDWLAEAVERHLSESVTA